MLTPINPTSQDAAHLRNQAERAASRFPALMAEAERIASSVVHGAHGRRRPGVGETFWEYRRHRPEDGARAVDWRRSARGDHLFVREAEWETANAAHLWRDGGANLQTGSRNLPTKSARASVCLMAVACLLVRGGERVAVLGETGRAGAGQSALEATAQALAHGPGALSAVETPDLPRYTRVVLASDFLDPIETWAVRLAGLEAQGAHCTLLRVIDPIEEDFPFTGRTRFDAASGSDQVMFGRAEEARTTYRKLWDDHGAQLTALTRRMGWHLIAHRTDRPAATAVLALYKALSEPLS